MPRHYFSTTSRLLFSTAICLLSFSTFLCGQEQTTETQHLTINGYDAVRIIIRGHGATTVKTVYRGQNGLKNRGNKVIIDSVHKHVTAIDTLYKPDGSIGSITTYEFSEDRWISSERFEYNEAGQITKGVKNEIGYDDTARKYQFNPETGLFDKVGVRLSAEELDMLLQERKLNGFSNYEDVPPTPMVNNSPKCPAPNSRLFIGYAFLNRDDGGEKVAYGGVDASFTWFFSNNYNATAEYHPPIRELGVGASIIYVTSYYEEAKLKISAFTAGPDLQFNWNNFSAGAFLHAGIVTDGYKLGDYKDNESNFTINPGTHFEYRFIKRNSIGLAVRPQFLLTKLNDESKLNFLISGGITCNFGCR